MHRPGHAERAHDICAPRVAHAASRGRPWRELDGVREQVVDDLLGLADIQPRLAQVIGRVEFEADMRAGRLLPDDRQAVGEQRLHVHRFQLERHHPRLRPWTGPGCR